MSDSRGDYQGHCHVTSVKGYFIHRSALRGKDGAHGMPVLMHWMLLIVEIFWDSCVSCKEASEEVSSAQRWDTSETAFHIPLMEMKAVTDYRFQSCVRLQIISFRTEGRI